MKKAITLLCLLTIGIIVTAVFASGLVTTPGSSATVSLLTITEMESFVGATCYPCKSGLKESTAAGGCQECITILGEPAESSHAKYSVGSGVRICEEKESEVALSCSEASGTINCGSGRWEYYSVSTCDADPDSASETTSHTVQTAEGDPC